MAVDVVAAAVLPVFCSAGRSPIRREALASAWNTAVERVNLVPRTCEVVVRLLLAMVVEVVEVVLLLLALLLLLLLLMLLLLVSLSF